VGRKNKYETHVKPYLEQIKEWYETLNEEQIAKKLGVSVASFENYKKQYPELKDVLRAGREHLVEELKTSLKKKAKGYFYEETRTTIRKEHGKEVQVIEKYKKYAQPDTGAIHLLLKNLDPTWRNDDQSTLDLKREKMELDKQKAENDNW